MVAPEPAQSHEHLAVSNIAVLKDDGSEKAQEADDKLDTSNDKSPASGTSSYTYATVSEISRPSQNANDHDNPTTLPIRLANQPTKTAGNSPEGDHQAESAEMPIEP